MFKKLLGCSCRQHTEEIWDQLIQSNFCTFRRSPALTGLGFLSLGIQTHLRLIISRSDLLQPEMIVMQFCCWGWTDSDCRRGTVDSDDNSRTKNGQLRKTGESLPSSCAEKLKPSSLWFVRAWWGVLTQRCQALTLALSWKGAVQYLNFVRSHIFKASVWITQAWTISKGLSMDTPCRLHRWLVLFGVSDIKGIRTFAFLCCLPFYED